MNEPFYNRDNCRYCKSKNLVDFLDLGSQPPSNSFINKSEFTNEKSFPLKLSFCNDCYLVQLRDVVSGSDIFDDYFYLSSSSKALIHHFEAMTQKITSQYNLSDGDLVVDIGCNDGITLDAYKNNLLCKVGVEPSNAGDIAKSKGHKIYKSFFNLDIAHEIVKDHGIANIVTATNVFAHVDDMDSFVQGIPTLISDTGIFIVELSYLPKMFDSNMFDVIYHEHLCYLSLHPLIEFLKKYDLQVFCVEEKDMGASGPSVKFYINSVKSHVKIDQSVMDMIEYEKEWGISDIRKYKEFSTRVFDIKDKTISMIDNLLAEGKTIGGFGAPAKGNTFLNFLELNDTKISKISENNEKKIGKYTPGSHIQIISDNDFNKYNYDYALLLAWNYKDFFLSNSEYIKHGGNFIIPFPIPYIE